MFQLPVSGISVTIRQPTGREDLLLQEPSLSGLPTCLALAESLARAVDNRRVEWNDLTLTDLEALMLLLRQTTLGNSVRAETHCIRSECAARVDVNFRVDEYLASQKPRIPRGIERQQESGWFLVAGEAVRFRLPRCRDLLSIPAGAGHANHAQRWLARCCVEPPDVTARLHKRIERAMSVMAAPLSGSLAGRCPECNGELSIHFDVVSFVLREMRDHAANIYQDVHLLALHYKWPEEKILELPRKRRLHYAEMIRGERSVA
jgi:hypothetical protein